MEKTIILEDCEWNIKSIEILFNCALIIYVISIVMEQTLWYELHSAGAVSLISQGCRYLAYLVCLYIIINRERSVKELLAIIAIFAITGLSMINSKDRAMFLYMLLLVAASKMDSRRLIKTVMKIQAVILLVTVLLSQTGFVRDIIFEPTRERHALGFTWCTTAPILYFYLMLEIVYVYRDRLKTIDFIIMEIINVFFYLLTDTKMTFFLSTAFLLFFCIEKFNKNRWFVLKKFNIIWILFPFITAVFSYVLTVSYSPYSIFMSSVNRLMSGRLELGIKAITRYGIPLIGQPIIWIGLGYNSVVINHEYNYVDCSYLQLAIKYGLIFLVLVLLLYSLLIIKAIRRMDYYLVSIVCIILIFAITEPRLMSFAFNPFPLLVFATLFNYYENLNL